MRTESKILQILVGDKTSRVLFSAQEQAQTNLEVSRHGTRVLAGPHGLNESSVRRRNFSAHSERILRVEFFTPPFRQHVLCQRRNVAHALQSTNIEQLLESQTSTNYS